MSFQIRGRRYEIVPEEVINATRNAPPNVGDGRNKYFVRLHGREYPIKQVLQLVTGLALPAFTAQYAYRILSALGFEILERPASVSVAVNATGDGADVLKLLVVFETDEDGWEVASCPTLPGCHSQGRTRDEALANIREAIGGYLASMREHGVPPPTSSRFEVVDVPV